MKIEIIDYGYKNIPKRVHYNDAGADVYSNEKYVIWPNETLKIPLGFGVKIPDGFMGIIQPRSGHASRGIIAQIAPIDSGYRGEIHAIITNTTQNKIIIEKNERVGQLVIIPIIIVDFVKEINDERGINAFNSSGK